MKKEYTRTYNESGGYLSPTDSLTNYLLQKENVEPMHQRSILVDSHNVNDAIERILNFDLGVPAAGITDAERLATSEIVTRAIEDTLTVLVLNSYRKNNSFIRTISDPVFTKNFLKSQMAFANRKVNMKLLREGAEIGHSKIELNSEHYKLETYSVIIDASRQAIINDSQNALTLIADEIADSGDRLDSELFCEPLLSNPELSDGDNLFSATRGNLGTAGVPSVETFQAAMDFFAKAVDKEGKKLHLECVSFLAGSNHIIDCENIWMPITPENEALEGRPNFISRSYTPYIDDGSYYFFCNNPGINICYLERSNGGAPMVSRQSGFVIDGLQLRVTHDSTVVLSDAATMFKNAGS